LLPLNAGAATNHQVIVKTFKRRRTVLIGLLLGATLLYGGVSQQDAQSTPALSRVPGTTCTVFPADNVWNTPIDHLPVNRRSAAWAASLPGKHLDIGFGPRGQKEFGFPFQIVDNSTPMISVVIKNLNESDPGPYPFNSETPTEPYDGGDAHAIMINKDTCILYELYDAHWNDWKGGKPYAHNGAIYDLKSNDLIYSASFPTGSVDDAGLPLFPGLVRYDEVQAGVIGHALRFEASRAYSGGVLWPGHDSPAYLNTLDPNAIWMGSRWRLKKSFDISHYSAQAQVILAALKKYGMFMSDIGYDWQLDGTLDARWPQNLVNELETVPSSEFEAVDESSLEMVHPGCKCYSGAVKKQRQQ
jgi:hypothetical protein